MPESSTSSIPTESSVNSTSSVTTPLTDIPMTEVNHLTTSVPFDQTVTSTQRPTPKSTTTVHPDRTESSDEDESTKTTKLTTTPTPNIRTNGKGRHRPNWYRVIPAWNGIKTSNRNWYGSYGQAYPNNHAVTESNLYPQDPYWKLVYQYRLIETRLERKSLQKSLAHTLAHYKQKLSDEILLLARMADTTVNIELIQMFNHMLQLSEDFQKKLFRFNQFDWIDKLN